LTLLVGRQEGHPACKKTEQWGAGVVICLEQGADLHMAQLMPVPLTVSCFSKIQIGFTFLVPAHPGSPGQRAVKRVCVCVCFVPYIAICSQSASGCHGNTPGLPSLTLWCGRSIARTHGRLIAIHHAAGRRQARGYYDDRQPCGNGDVVGRSLINRLNGAACCSVHIHTQHGVTE